MADGDRTRDLWNHKYPPTPSHSSDFARTCRILPARSPDANRCEQMRTDSIACELSPYWRMASISNAVHTVLAFWRETAQLSASTLLSCSPTTSSSAPRCCGVLKTAEDDLDCPEGVAAPSNNGAAALDRGRVRRIPDRLLPQRLVQPRRPQQHVTQPPLHRLRIQARSYSALADLLCIVSRPAIPSPPGIDTVRRADESDFN